MERNIKLIINYYHDIFIIGKNIQWTKDIIIIDGDHAIDKLLLYKHNMLGSNVLITK